jgi:hypothetical protein
MPLDTNRSFASAAILLRLSSPKSLGLLSAATMDVPPTQIIPRPCATNVSRGSELQFRHQTSFLDGPYNSFILQKS